MDLGHKQRIFAPLAAKLILYAYQMGYQIAIGDCQRSIEEQKRLVVEGKGAWPSAHCNRLAIDLMLFQQDHYFQDTPSYNFLGEFWESLSEPEEDILCCWGGRFQNRPDGNHFSIEHEGIK